MKIEYIFFALTLLGIALFHKYALQVALSGLVVVVVYKVGFTDIDIIDHFNEEKMDLLNLLGLLVGFGILAHHFAESRIPELLPRFLPDDWKGGFMLLLIIMVLSSFLDNIAAAMIGGTIAGVVFKNKVHIGYIAAIVAASNAGGSGSVVGDTTTTMMWIDGVAPLPLLNAYIAVLPAVLFFGIIASIQQDRYQRIQADPEPGIKINYKRLAIVGLILTGAVLTNVFFEFPAAGAWIAILIGALVVKTSWKEVPESIKGSVFLLSLVISASLMPVDSLPEPSPGSTFALGAISAFFDNIPLTKLALCQGGYDWPLLAFAVGFGGSMMWFGSSAGVAITNKYKEARTVFGWLKAAWHIPLAYAISFWFMYLIHGWKI